MINVALIGVGVWGKNYVRVLSELSEANLKLISDVKEENTRKFADLYNLSSTTDYTEILEDSSIDAVCVCVPASFHHEVVKRCLKAGKHVLVEKPLATDSDKGKELVELAENKGLILTAGHIFRFNPGVIRLKEEIKKGTFGKIRFMYGSRMGLMTPRPDCGVVTDFALHDFDTFCFLLDRYPDEVTCTASSYEGSDYEDVGFCTLRFGRDIIANIGVSWMTPKKVRNLWIIGEKCSASLDYLSQEIRMFYTGLIPEYDSFGEFKLLTRQEGDTIIPYIAIREPLKEEIAHFLDCVENGKTPKVDGKIANNIVKIIEAAGRSAKEKKAVRLEDDVWV